MATTLEVLHAKVRELGGRQVQSLLPPMHTNKFSGIVAGVSPITPELEKHIQMLWAEDFQAEPQPETEGIQGNIGANQLNFTVLMPVRNTYDPATVNSIVGLVRRTGCGWMQRPFDSMIARSRNMLAAAFLRSDFEWSLWLDDDMVVPNGDPGWFRATLGAAVPDEFAGLIAPYQLASWGKTLVSAVYFSRHGQPQITAGFPAGVSIKNRLPHKGLLPANYCGFGCVLVHRKVYEDILIKHPELWKDHGAECQVFSPFPTSDRVAGEDEAFCTRAKEVGHDTFLDMSVVCGHVGRKVNFIPEMLK